MKKRTRRPRRTGTLFQRGAVWWIGFASADGYVRESSGSTEREVAEQLLRERLAASGAGRYRRDAQRATVAQLVERVLLDYEQRGKASLPTMRGHVRAWIEACGAQRASEVTYSQLDQLGHRWLGEGYGPATVNRRMAALRYGYRLAQRDTPQLLVPQFPHFTEPEPREGFVEPEQLRRLLDALPDDDLRDFVSWFGACGMRPGAIRSLTWAMVFADGKGGEELRLPRSGGNKKKPDVLPLVGPLAEIVARRRDKRRLSCTLIFHRDGRPLGDFRKAWRTACRASGLGDLLPYDLRRSALRTLRLAGVPEEVCMSISGHRTVATFRRYRIVATEEKAAAMDTLRQHLARVTA